MIWQDSSVCESLKPIAVTIRLGFDLISVQRAWPLSNTEQTCPYSGDAPAAGDISNVADDRSCRARFLRSVARRDVVPQTLNLFNYTARELRRVTSTLVLATLTTL